MYIQTECPSPVSVTNHVGCASSIKKKKTSNIAANREIKIPIYAIIAYCIRLRLVKQISPRNTPIGGACITNLQNKLLCAATVINVLVDYYAGHEESCS